MSARVLILLLSSVALRCGAQVVTDPTFTQALQQTRSSLVIRNGKLTGEGGDLLRHEIADSRFVLIGETHLTREIPRFAEAVCAEMRPDAYAVEAGPLAARYVTGQLHDPKREANLRAMLRQHGSSMAFLDIRDESDLAAGCAAASGHPDFQLWGLDQEFLGAGGTLLDAMLATKPGPASLAAIQSAQAHEEIAERLARRSGDVKQLYLISIPDADLRQVTGAVEKDGTPETARIWREFTESRRIYQLSLAGQPESNHVRAEMLKQHLMANYLLLHDRNPQARVLFKFGAMHMGRGFDMLHQLNLGNTVAEMADVENVRSLHIFILGVAGTSAAQGGYGQPLSLEPFDLKSDKDIGWISPAISTLIPSTGKDGEDALTLMDLRQLRFRKLTMSPEWQQLIYSYDILIMVPHVSPATSLELQQ